MSSAAVWIEGKRCTVRPVETGLRLGFIDNPTGLDLALQGRVLLFHDGGYQRLGGRIAGKLGSGEQAAGSADVSPRFSWTKWPGRRAALWDLLPMLIPVARVEGITSRAILFL